MKNCSTTKSAFLGPRLLAAVILCATGLCLTLAGFAAGPSGTASSASDSAPQWSIVASPNSSVWPDSELRSVACASASDCWAVGSSKDENAIADGQPLKSDALIEHWDGKAWSAVAPAKLDSDAAFLNGVTCVSAVDCWAVGEYDKGSQGTTTLIEHWDGKMWSVVPSPNLNSATGLPADLLYSVTCTSASNCWAVGGYWVAFAAAGSPIGGANAALFQTLTEHWDGSSWTIVSSPNVDNINNLLGVACASASDCQAVGFSEAQAGTGTVAFGAAEEISEPLTEHWDGTSWRVVRSPLYVPDPSVIQIPGAIILYTLEKAAYWGVACPGSVCWAAGGFSQPDDGPIKKYYTLISQWDGTQWSAVASPNPAPRINYLRSIACPSASECWAVGEYNPETDHGQPGELTFRTLTEHWDGTNWNLVSSPNVTNAVSHQLFGVTCASALDCWAVGYYRTADNSAGVHDHTLIEHYGTPAVAPVSPTQLLNISTRARVGTGDDALIGGFIITGSAPQKVVLRAIGPSLPVSDALADPVLELHSPDGTVVTNDNWKVNDQTQQSQEADVNATGVPPSNDAESAIIATLTPGAYTAVVRGKNGGTGVALVEAFALTPTVDSKLANISTRGFVDTGDNVMIGGFIVGSNQPMTNVVARAIGPSLGAAGVSGALSDPSLELHDGNGALLASNDNWQDDPAAATIQEDQLAPADPRESATFRSLPPGNYTAIVRGVGDATGVGLVEAYNVQ